MKNRTIGQLIVICGLVLIALLLAISGAALYGFHGVTRSAESLRTDVMPGVLISANLNQDMEEEYIALLEGSRATSDTERTAQLTHSDEQIATVAKEIKAYSEQIN